MFKNLSDILLRIWLVLNAVIQLARRVVIQLLRASGFPEKKNTEVDPVKVPEKGLDGITFNPWTWNFILTPLIIITLSALTMILVVFVDSYGFNFITDWIWFGLGMVAVSILLLQIPQSKIEVPVAHVAILLILGMRVRVYLSEGVYFWVNFPPFITRSTDDREGFTTNGYVNIGQIPVNIWNSSHDKTLPDLQRGIIEVVSRDSVTIFARLLIVVEVFSPYRILQSADPLLDIAERARQALRTSVAFFTAIDNAAIKSVLGVLMSGKTIIVTFIKTVVGGKAQGSVVTDESGNHLYRLIKDGENTGTARSNYENDLDTRVRGAMRLASRGEDDAWLIEERSVDASLDEVVDAAGCRLIRATVSNIGLAQSLADAAGEAAKEQLQRDAEIANAGAFAQARKIISDARSEHPGTELDDMIAGARNLAPGAVKIIHVSGGAGELAKAAAIIANQTEGSKR